MKDGKGIMYLKYPESEKRKEFISFIVEAVVFAYNGERMMINLGRRKHHSELQVIDKFWPHSQCSEFLLYSSYRQLLFLCHQSFACRLKESRTSAR